MRGGFQAFDSSGNSYQLWGTSTSLYGIVADGTPTQLVSSATLSSTWDCASSQANSYCVNSNRDVYLLTNGTTKTWNTSPLGTMVEATPDRIAVSGISGAPNSIYVSQSNTFTNFTTGVNATDPFVEPISSPGSKLTHIRWGCGKLLWWKDQSFGYMDFEDQYQLQVKIVSDVIGTFDNTSAIDPGGQVWFRGQDGHTYMYNCSFLEKMSTDITPYVQASGKRTANLWTQTTQADWEAGAFRPTGNFSTTISVGDIVTSSFTTTDTSSTTFASGTTSNTTVFPTYVRISTDNAGTINDPSFEGTLTDDFSATASVAFDTTEAGQSCTLTPQSGSKFLRLAAGNSSGRTSPSTYGVKIIDSNGTVLDTKSSSSADNACAWTSQTFTSSSNIGKRVKFAFFQTADNLGTTVVDVATTTASHIFSGAISYYYSCNKTSPGGSSWWCSFDNVSGGSSTITSGSFTSQTFDTAITSTVVLGLANWTVATSTPYFEVQVASSTVGRWVKVASSSNTNATNGERYVRYLSSFTVGATENALTTLDDVTVVAKSTGGVFYSAVKNAPNINGWSTFSANTLTSGGSHSFYMRSATNTITVTNSTPTWTAQSNGALVTITTGTYFQVSDTFTVTSATSPFSLEDFTINWFEGSATDQAYMLYFDDAIWESVAYGAGQAINNYIFRFDLLNQGWTLYNIGTGGMLIAANTLYFGDSSATTGSVYNFGTATSDNGTAINAYWKSKDFTGPDPFLQVALNQVDVFAKKDSGTTLTATYTTDTSTSTAYSVNLSTSNAIVQSRKLLPSGKLGYTFNYKLEDTSTSSDWEVLGYRILFTPQPYRPAN